MYAYIYTYSVGHYTQTQLFLTPPPNPPLAGEWPKLFRENNVELTRFDGVCTPVFAQKLANFPEGLLCPGMHTTRGWPV